MCDALDTTKSIRIGGISNFHSTSHLNVEKKEINEKHQKPKSSNLVGAIKSHSKEIKNTLANAIRKLAIFVVDYNRKSIVIHSIRSRLVRAHAIAIQIQKTQQK